MFKLPEHLRPVVHHTSRSDELTSGFQSEDVNAWTKLFDRSQTLNEEDRSQVNHIFNKLLTNILKHEREQDLQLLDALAKRLLSADRDRPEENDDQSILTAVDQDRLVKLRAICKRSKQYHFMEKLLSTMPVRDKSSGLILPPISKKSQHARSSSLSFDDTHIVPPTRKRHHTSDIDSPTTSRPRSKRLTMHGPVTLQNVYQAIPTAALHFSEDEYIWHMNRPVKMILAAAVELPNVLTQSLPNQNADSDQFFSKFIEDLLLEHQRRYPATKDWPQQRCYDDDSSTPRQLNGFETLVDVVQRRHLGKLQRYFLNVVSTNRHYNPYDLITVPEYKVNPDNHYVFSVFGILNVRQNGHDVEHFELAEWYRHAKLWHACRQIPFFRDFLIRKEFYLWLDNARFLRFARRRSQIRDKHLLLMNNRIFQVAIIEIRRMLLEYERLTLLPKLFQGMSLSLTDFETMVNRHTKDTVAYTNKFFSHVKTIIDMTRETCAKKMHVILKCLEEDNVTLNSTAGSIYEQRIRKENLRKELEQMQNDIRNICPFLNLCSAMLASSLCDIERQTLSQWTLSDVTFLTKLHLSDFDSTRMLQCRPSFDDYMEQFQQVLQQPQQMLTDQWNELLELDTCLRDVDKFGATIRQEGLTRQCEKCGQDLYPGLQEICKCGKQQQTKVPGDDSGGLSIKGHGFFGSTTRNRLLSFELIFTKDDEYDRMIKFVLTQLRLTFNELDTYCESNEWLSEINRFCLEWTPNKMKQMFEGKQVFLIEEQLNLLRGWIDKTRTFEKSFSTSNSPYFFRVDCSVISQDLYGKVERIYLDLGKYLYRYACSHAQTLISKFQEALQTLDDRPSIIEEFAKYATFLASHKKDLSSNQQSIEYLSSLFEVVFMHFGQLRQENENENRPIDKFLSDTWKLFQKKLSDAADFVAQQTLIFSERLRDTFEKYLAEADALVDQSTSGIFLDPTQDPMQIVKLLRKNCLEFMALEKQLRQYAEWRALLATTSLSPSLNDRAESSDIDRVDQWSNDIELRKDIWKYVEITVSSIKEWNNTYLNKFNIRRAQDKIECWLKIAEDFRTKLPEDDPVLLRWIEILQEYEQTLDLLKKLLSDAMTAEQWTLLFRANGQVYDPQQNYRIQDLLDLNILQMQNQHIFIQIHKQATREQKLKDKLTHIQTWLNELNYRMSKYRPTLKIAPVAHRLTSSYRQRLGRYRELRSRTSSSQPTPDIPEPTTEQVEETYILINAQEILYLVEDRQLLLHSNEPFRGSVDSRREQYQQYYTLLDDVKRLTELWNETQNKWIFLRSALANLNVTDDNQSNLKDIHVKFIEIDENFRHYQKLAFQNPSVAGLAKVETNRVHFETWLLAFDQLIGQLEFYLNEQYRSKFGRFYFLSNDDLVNLIACGQDPRLYLRFVRQLFNGIHNIGFHLTAQRGSASTNQTMGSAAVDVYAYRLEAMSVSNIDKEELPLISPLKLALPTADGIGQSTHLISSYSLTRWFQSLDTLAKNSVAKLVFQLFDEKMDQQIAVKHWKRHSRGKYPRQVITLVEHLCFGLKLQKQLAKKNRMFIGNMRITIEDQINGLVANSHTSLVLQQLYFRDVLSRLAKVGDSLTEKSYEWLSLLKYEIDSDSTKTEKIHLVQFYNRIPYNFEYLEPSSTLIISPMMERTLFHLSQAISAHRIGVVHAPPQYGRSSIVATLAQLCGTHCASLFCDQSTRIDQIKNYHQGTVTSNSWCLLENIHRLSTGCLSALAIAMRHIRVQLEERQTTVDHPNRQLKRCKSQSELSASQFTRMKSRSNEYPMINKFDNEYALTMNDTREIISYPFSYGLFATTDDQYRPLSPSIKFECRTISMSRPDLKPIVESMLIARRLVEVKEQNECHRITQNLVDLIDYLQLVFHEMKHRYSPFVLLRDILDRATTIGLKGAIVIVLERYQLFDSTVPQMIDKFFVDSPSQSVENEDDELRFVDRLKQQASDDKIEFDSSTQIFQKGSRLMSAFKRTNLIFLIGPSGSGKSSLIRLVERTTNRRLSTANVDASENGDEQGLVTITKVYPNAFDEDQFFRSKTSFLDQWKRHRSTWPINDTLIDQEHWLVLDLHSHSTWLTSEKIEYLYDFLITSTSKHGGTVKLLIESDALPNDGCSALLGKCFILQLDPFKSRFPLIESGVRDIESRFHLQESKLSSITDFLTTIIEPYIAYIEKEHVCDAFVDTLSHSFVKILSAYIEQHLADVQQNNEGFDYIFAYCFIWAYVHPIHTRYQMQVNAFVRDLLSSYNLPPMDCKLTDLYPQMSDSSSACFVSIRSWLSARQISYDCATEFEGTMRLMSMLMSNNCPLGVFSHQSGFGKTTLVKRLLSDAHYIRLISTGERPSLLHDELFKSNGPVLAHTKATRGNRFVIWIEDVEEGDLDLIRSWIDEYSSSTRHPWNLIVTGRSLSSSTRFSHHFVPVVIHESLSTLIGSIYSIPIKDWLEEFSVDAISHPIELAQACLLTLEETFDFLGQYLTKTNWNLHHVESVVNGMFLLDGKAKRHDHGRHLIKTENKTTKKKQQDEQVVTIVKLLCHELSRVILDQLTNKRERVLFQDFLYKTIVANFCTELEFHIVSTNETDATGVSQMDAPAQPVVPVVVGKKRVKFKLGLVSDRAAMASLDGPLVPFGKLVGLPKIKDPLKVTNSEELAEKLCLQTYFSKQIFPMHGDFIGNRDAFTNQYREANETELSEALQSCQTKMGKIPHMDLAFISRACRHLTNLVRVFCLSNNGHALLRAPTTGMGRQDFVQLAAYITRQQFFDAHSNIPLIDEDESVRQCLRSCCLLAGVKQKNNVVLVRINFLSDRMIKRLDLFTREGTYPGLYSHEELLRIAAALSPGLPTTRRVAKTNSVLKTFYARIRKRLHLVLLENSHQQNSDPRQPSLLSSCYVDQYEKWTREEIMAIAKHWIESKMDISSKFQAAGQIDLVSQVLADIHLSFVHLPTLTLKNVHKSIELMLKFHQTIAQNEHDRRARNQSMLNRSNKADRIIERHQQLCIQLQGEIDIIQENLAKVESELKAKKQSFSVALDDCREEEKLIAEMTIALERLRQDMQADMEKANPQYESALHALKMLCKADYDEIRTFRQPPQPVLAVMNTICIMFHRKPEWSEAKILMVKENFFDDLVFYDKDNMSDDVFHMLAKIVEFDTFHPSFVACSSKAASSLCSWIIAVYEYAKIARSQKTKIEQVKAYQELYNKRQHILGEKRLRAEKIKQELSESIHQRHLHATDLQSKIKRQNSFQSTIDKTRAMLTLLDEDIKHWKEEFDEANVNEQTSVADALLVALTFCYLSQFNVDRRQIIMQQWKETILDHRFPIRPKFNVLDLILSEKELNDHLLKQESISIPDSNFIFNAMTLANRLENTFVLVVNNPEEEMSAWIDLLKTNTKVDGRRAHEELELYHEYEQNRGPITSADALTGYQDRSQLFSRVSSSKSHVTEITEKSSLWESTTVVSRAATSTALAKSAATVTLSDIEQNKHLLSIPEYPDEQYQRPENNLIRTHGRETNLDKILLDAIHFGVVVLIDECDFLQLNPFLYRLLHWSSRREQCQILFPNLFRFGDQDVFINSSFRLILNFRQIDHTQWSDVLLKNRFVDLSSSEMRIENDLWIRLVELKCQSTFAQQCRGNQRNHLLTINERIERRAKLMETLETKENLMADSEDWLTMLNQFHRDRISIDNALEEHRIQREKLNMRGGAQAYRQTARDLAQVYLLLRDSNIGSRISIKWFAQILTKDLSKRMDANPTTDNLDLSNKVQARECYLRCFESIYSYLLWSMSHDELQCFLTVLALIKQEMNDSLHLFRWILLKYFSHHRKVIPHFLDDPIRPEWIDNHSWTMCLDDEINKKYPNLAQHLIDHQGEWKEYLFSMNKFDFLNTCPLEETTSIPIIDRFLLCVVLQPEKTLELMDTFLIYHYGGLLRAKSPSNIDDVYRLLSSEILVPNNNLILVWTSSSAFVDSIDEIRTLAIQMKQRVRLVSSIDGQRVRRPSVHRSESWLIITDLHLFNKNFQQVQDFILSSIDTKIWLLCDPQHRSDVPDWLSQRCLQVYLGDSSPSALHLRLQQQIDSEQQVESAVVLHSHLLGKKLFSNNWINLTENDFRLDLQHCLDTDRKVMFNYSNSIQNQDEQTLIDYIEQSDHSLAFIETVPYPPRTMTREIFSTLEHLFASVTLPLGTGDSAEEDEMLLVESIARSYLTILRSVSPFRRLQSTCSSLIDFFIVAECRLLESIESDLCSRMEHLLDVIAGIETSSSQTESLIRSILYDSNMSNFVIHYGSALEKNCSNVSNSVNLRFIRRRKQIIEVMRLEQTRRQIKHLRFHLKNDSNLPRTILPTLSGIHSSMDRQKNRVICLAESSPNGTDRLSAVMLETNQINPPIYLSLIDDDTNNSVALLRFSIDKPHI